MAEYDVKGKVAVVTGGGSGISHAFTRELLAAGASVVVADLKLRPEAEKTLAEYPYTNGDVSKPSAVFQKTDVGDWTQLNALWEAALAKYKRVDIVVNGAGIFEPPESSFWNPPGVSPLSKDDPNAAIGQYKLFAVNVVGPIRLAQIAIDYWLQNREIKGNLLWVSSMGAYVHSMQTPLYFASKAAMLSVVKNLQGLNQVVGIRNSAICPGPVRTPIFEQDYCKDRLGPDDMALTPEQVAEVMLQLATKPEYGNGNAVEIMLVGSPEEPVVHTREVPIMSLYPTVNPLGGATKAMEEEFKFMGNIAQKGMRASVI